MKYVSKHIIIILAILFAISQTSIIRAGNTGKVAGTITDNKTGEGLFGANIIIVGTNYGASTDAEGRYYIINIPPGEYNIKASYIGYGAKQISDVKVIVDKTTTVNFQLQSESFTTSELVITAFQSKTIQPDRTSTEQIYQSDDIKNIEGMVNVQNVINLQADVVDNHYRGGRVGETNYFVNGVSIVNPLSNNASFQPMVSALEQISVITSGFSAEYGNAQSGVVNMSMKEGGETWKTSFIAESDLPHLSHWGESVYSTEARQYDDLLRNVKTWYTSLGTYGVNESLRLFERGGGSGFSVSQFAFSGRFIANELAFLAMNEYLLSANEIGRDYKNDLDRRYEMNVSGPLSEKVKLFVAGQYRQTQNKIPYYIPNNEYQIMGNLSYKPNDKNSFSVQYMQYQSLDYDNFNIINPYYSFDIQNEESYVTQVSLKWQNIISKSTFLNASLGYFGSGTHTRSPLVVPGQGQGDYLLSTYEIITDMIGSPINGRYGVKESETYSFVADYTSQIDYYNLIKAGLQLNYTHIFSDFVSTINGSSLNPDGLVPKDQVFDYYPYEGAIYIQDKIEYEGIFFNAGLRWDFYNFNTDAFTDVVSPTRNPNFISISETPDEKYYDESKAAKESTKLVGKIQPRLGISFPIGETAVFHVNYGLFIQRPQLTRIYQRSRIVEGNSVIYNSLGNPNLKPEETTSYDIGVVFGLPFNLSLDISAYQKSVKNLLSYGTYIDEQKKDYETTINRDYANIEGFHINLEGTSEHINLFVRYNWQQATGKSEGGSSDGEKFVENGKYGPLTTSSTIQPDDEFMDYDRTHKVVTNLTLKSDKSNLFGIEFLGDVTLSATFRFMTGRPFTYDPTGQNLIKNKRTRSEYDLSLRLTKGFTFSGVDCLFYAEAFNVLDYKALAFNYLNGNVRNTQRYYAMEPGYSRNDLNLGDFWWDNSLSAYSNQPRHYRIGFQINL